MEFDPNRFVEGFSVGRRGAVLNSVATEKELVVTRGQEYTNEQFEKAIENTLKAVPKIRGLYVVEGGELKFQKVF
jgi:hypothetical protein